MFTADYHTAVVIDPISLQIEAYKVFPDGKYVLRPFAIYWNELETPYSAQYPAELPPPPPPPPPPQPPPQMPPPYRHKVDYTPAIRPISVNLQDGRKLPPSRTKSAFNTHNMEMVGFLLIVIGLISALVIIQIEFSGIETFLGIHTTPGHGPVFIALLENSLLLVVVGGIFIYISRHYRIR
jgi:hypothetical protein